jgi:predicted transcriptional regulator of viral defense system
MTLDRGLALVDGLRAEGATSVSAEEVQFRLGLSPQAASNVLRRLVEAGLLERVRPGSYAIRDLGVLGTSVASESLPVAVAAALPGVEHRIGYRSALDELGLIVHPARTVQVAAVRQVRKQSISGRPLRTVIEPHDRIYLGAEHVGPSRISGLERALLDAAARPRLVGGVTVLAEALQAAAPKIDAARLTELADDLRWGAALRRIGSIADRLPIDALRGRLEPRVIPSADVELEPKGPRRTTWRDPRWWVRWNYEPNELLNVIYQ